MMSEEVTGMQSEVDKTEKADEQNGLYMCGTFMKQ